MLLFDVFLALLPSPLKIRLMNSFMGARIHSSAHIGLSIVQAKNLIMGEKARIGNFNLISHLEVLEMGQGAKIGDFNRISGSSPRSMMEYKTKSNRKSALIMGDESAIVRFHYLDCSDQISLGKRSYILSMRTVLYTHGINKRTNKQEVAPIRIGDNCDIGTSCFILRGACLPDGSTLAANSTLHKPYTETYKIYSGVPAVPIRDNDPEWPYFHREESFVT